MTQEKVFVYGTLKTGFGNHRLLKNFKGKEALALEIDLHSGPGFPYAKRGNGVTKGEVYNVDYDTLRRLDMLEGVPDHYKRERTSIIVDNKKEHSWIYLSPANAVKYPKIEEGIWR